MKPRPTASTSTTTTSGPDHRRRIHATEPRRAGRGLRADRPLQRRGSPDRATEAPGLIPVRARVQGLLVGDFATRFGEASERLGRWVASGELQHRETVVEGLENAPDAFLGSSLATTSASRWCGCRPLTRSNERRHPDRRHGRRRRLSAQHAGSELSATVEVSRPLCLRTDVPRRASQTERPPAGVPPPSGAGMARVSNDCPRRRRTRTNRRRRDCRRSRGARNRCADGRPRRRRDPAVARPRPSGRGQRRPPRTHRGWPHGRLRDALTGRGRVSACASISTRSRFTNRRSPITGRRRGFRSEHDGYMHACGHDAHLAIALGTLEAVKQSPFEGNAQGVLPAGRGDLRRRQGDGRERSPRRRRLPVRASRRLRSPDG